MDGGTRKKAEEAHEQRREKLRSDAGLTQKKVKKSNFLTSETEQPRISAEEPTHAAGDL